MKSEPASRVVLVTCATLAQARKIARKVVTRRLAACVTIVLGPVESIYRWRTKVEKAREWLLVIKTSARRVHQLEAEIQRWHSYEVPEFIVLPVSGASRSYLAWLTSSTNSSSR